MEIYLGPYEGAHAENLKLNDPPLVQIPRESIHVRAPEWSQQRRRIEFDLVLSGAHDAVWNVLQKLERLARWSEERADAAAQRLPLVFSVYAGGRWVYWDVRDVETSYEEWFPDVGFARCRVQLLVFPLARGSRQQALAATSVNAVQELTVTNVPGDAPALALVTFQDSSTSGEVVRRLRIGRALSGLAGQLVHDAVAASGATTVSDSTAYGGSHARRTLGTSWTAIATVAPGTPAPAGTFDIWVRARDQSEALATPQNLTATPNPTGMVRQFATGNFAANQALTVTFNDLPLVGSTIIGVFRCTGASRPEPGGVAGWTLAHSDTTSTGHLYIYFVEVTPQTQKKSWTFSLQNMSLTGNVTLIEVTSRLSSPIGARQAYSQTGTTGNTPSPSQSQRQVHEFYLATMFLASGNATMYLNSNGPFTLVTYNQPSTTGMIRIDAFTKTASQESVNNAYWWSTTTSATYNFAINQVQWLASPPNVAGNIPPQTLLFSVVAKNASGASAPSAVVAATLETGGAVALSWSAVPGATSYDLYYFSERTGEWRVVNTTSTSYVLTSDTAGTSVGQFFAAGGTELRAVALVGQADAVVGPSVLMPGAGWQWVHLGTIPLPPQQRGVASLSPWLLRVEGRSASSATLDIDCVVLLDHLGAQVEVEVATTPPSGATWVIEPALYDRSMAVVKSGSTVVAAAQVVGLLTLEPGENRLVVMLESNSGVPTITNPKGTLAIDVIPRYAALHRGA
ncbi:MAG: hypothetical protein RMJ05_06875 [Thermomicrobium sp.]|nr:hypothetical protein [Thermomicrobium sp.]MDW8059988.1 hypothetical protein [Thermomicrobium sp.]